MPSDLNKCPVRIVTTTWPPFILPFQEREFTNKLINIGNEGIEIKLLQTISEKMNFGLNFQCMHFLFKFMNANVSFSYFLRIEDDAKWGEVRENRVGTGMFGIMSRAKADIGVACITPRENIHAIFDFTVQYLQVISKLF